MSLQEPHLFYHAAYSGMHDSAHNTAQHGFLDETVEAVKKADEQCRNLYKMRQQAADFLKSVDKAYHTAWDEAYRRATGGKREGEQVLPCSTACALADFPCGYLSKDGKRLCRRNWETM